MKRFVHVIYILFLSFSPRLILDLFFVDLQQEESLEQEKELMKYLLKASEIYFGILL